MIKSLKFAQYRVLYLMKIATLVHQETPQKFSEDLFCIQQLFNHNYKEYE